MSLIEKELINARRERDEARTEADALRRARADLAAKYDELLVALHGIGRALGIEEADRSPYSITCGVLAMANRLAEIEQAEPVAWLYHDARTAHEAHPWLHSTMVVLNADRRPGLRGETPLYTRPSPAAAPERAEPARQELTALERELLEALQGAYSLAIGHTATYQHQHQLDGPHPTHAEILNQSRAAIAKASAPTADVPAPAEPQPRPVCATNGLLGATSGVGRECDLWIGGACTTQEPCQHQQHPCHCRRCLTERGDLLTLASTMILCPNCGHKRCPHATDHRNACTGSNEPGQPGSWYGGMLERDDSGEREALLSQARTELRRCPQLTPEGIEAFSVCVAAALAARPCYCGQDGCSDSVACPKKSSTA